jgi:hypothetical protein
MVRTFPRADDHDQPTAAEKRGEWVPTKRVQSSLGGLTKQRQRVHATRTVLKDKSFKTFREVQIADDSFGVQ